MSINMDELNPDHIPRVLIIDDDLELHESYKNIFGIDERASKKKNSNILDPFADADKGNKENENEFTLPNFEIDFVFHGEEGLEKVKKANEEQRPYSLVFVDMRMDPGWNGIETIQNIWKIEPDIQMVLCTAYSDLSWKQLVKRLGKTDRFLILKKPFSREEVLQTTYALTSKWELVNRLENIVKTRTKELEKESTSRKELIHILCHDLINPISGVEILSGMAKKSGLDEINMDLKNYSSFIHEEMGNSLHIIELVSTIQALETGKKELDLKNINLARCTLKSINMLSEKTKAKNIEIVTDLPKDFFALAEETSFTYSVITNLLTNALKFSPQKSNIKITGEIEEDKVTLSVKDQGIGMPKDLLENIFSPIKRTTRDGLSGEKGTGFGMPLVKKFVESYGGTIKISSKERKVDRRDHGTEIIITLKKVT